MSCLLWAPQPWWKATSPWCASAEIWRSCFLHLLPQLCLGHSSWLSLLLEGTHSGPVQECLEKEVMWQHSETRQTQRHSNSSFQTRYMEECSSWGFLCTVGHSFVLSWHSHLISNYWIDKKCVSLHCGASEREKQKLGLRHHFLHTSAKHRPGETKFRQIHCILTQEIIWRESFEIPHLKHQLSRYFAFCLF